MHPHKKNANRRGKVISCTAFLCPILLIQTQSGKFAQDKNRGDVHKVIVDNFLTPVKNVLLKHREYTRTHSREDIEEKFGPGGVKGFKGWVASQKSQENARRDRMNNKSGLDGLLCLKF